MADYASELASLRSLVSVFVTNDATWRSGLMEGLTAIRHATSSPYLFGGVLRDLLTHGSSVRPRDVDLVVDGPSTDDLVNGLQLYVRRRTRFGGLNLKVQDWHFDVWSLGHTWAFRERHVSGGEFAHLPLTTFLNIEAVAVELFPSKGMARRVYEKGFFQATRERNIEINLLPNPYPLLNIVRALRAALQLSYSLGPRLVEYTLAHTRSIDLAELVEVQRTHYGNVVLSEEMLWHSLKNMEDQHRISRMGRVHIAVTSPPLRDAGADRIIPLPANRHADRRG